MKKLVSLLLVVLLICPIFVNAASKELEEVDLKKYKSEAIEDVLTQEEVKFDFKHTNSDSHVKVYLFRGHGCGYCHKFLEFAAGTLMKDYVDKVDIVSYEVWYDQDNAELMENIAEFLETSASGVPFIVIGDTYYPGYSEEMNESMIAKINEQYAAKEKYDVLQEYAKSINDEIAKQRNEKFMNTYLGIICTAVFVAIGTVVCVINTNKKFEALSEKAENIEKKAAKPQPVVREEKEDKRPQQKKGKNKK